MLPHLRVTRVRRAVFWIAVAAYLAALPVVFMFAFGIHVKPDVNQPLVETASLQVTTVPSNVQIALKGRRPRRSPAVFDGLADGSYEFSASAAEALPWTGTLEAKSGIAYLIPQLKMVSSKPPRNVLSASTAVDPVLFREGRSFAFLPKGEGTIALATKHWDAVSVERLDLPIEAMGSGVSLSLLEVPGQLALSWQSPDGAQYVLGVRASDAVLPAKVILPPRVVPPSAVAVVSAGGDVTESLVTLEEQGVVRFSAAGVRSTLVRFGGRLIAYGYIHGRLYMLDAKGEVSQYGVPILPPRVARVDMPDGGEGMGAVMGRIIAATDEMVACISPESQTILVCTPARYSIYRGFDGGCPSAARGEFWAWAGNTLFVSQHGEPPRELARLGGRILGVQEEFAPLHVAVETESGVFLLPSVVAREAAVRFDPLLLFPTQATIRARACGEGGLLVQDVGASSVDAYEMMWYRP